MCCLRGPSGARDTTLPIKKAGLSGGVAGQWTVSPYHDADPARYFRTSYGARSTDGTLSRGAQSSAARCRGLPRASAATRIKSGSDGPKARRVTHHDRLESVEGEPAAPLRWRCPRPTLRIPAAPCRPLEGFGSLVLPWCTTSDGAALTWRQSQPNHPLTGAGSRLVLWPRQPKRQGEAGSPPTFKECG